MFIDVVSELEMVVYKNDPIIAIPDGTFHLNELIGACVLGAIIEKSEKHLNITMLRTHNTSEVNKCAYAIEVGGIYSPEQGKYDYHDPKTPKRESGQQYATTGLIWKQFGHEYVQYLWDHRGNHPISQERIHTIWQEVDNQFIQKLDEQKFHHVENGDFDFATLVKLYNQLSYTPGSNENRIFKRALEMVSENLVNIILDITLKTIGQDAVTNASMLENDQLLVLEHPFQWKKLVLTVPKFRNVKLVIFQKGLYSWELHCVPMKFKFPQHWSGIYEYTLENLLGIVGAQSCNEDATVCTAKTRTAIILMAKKALEESGM